MSWYAVRCCLSLPSVLVYADLIEHLYILHRLTNIAVGTLSISGAGVLYAGDFHPAVNVVKREADDKTCVSRLTCALVLAGYSFLMWGCKHKKRATTVFHPPRRIQDCRGRKHLRSQVIVDSCILPTEAPDIFVLNGVESNPPRTLQALQHTLSLSCLAGRHAY